MTSDYNYTTLAKLEKYSIRDYSTIDSLFTDAAVEAKISDAERYIIGYVGTIFTGTIPADIELVTNIITEIMLENWMIKHSLGRYAQEQGIEKEILERLDVVNILEKYKDLYKASVGIFISKRSHAGIDKAYGSLSSKRPYGW